MDVNKIKRSNKMFITGTSSGLGLALVKRFNDNGNSVWGVARRALLLRNLKKELKYPEKYFYSAVDVTEKDAWKKITRSLKSKRFYPDIVIFNAAILKNDLGDQVDISKTREMMETNYFAVIQGVKELMPLLPQGSQVIAISSSSAFKGSGEAGMGYAASKAALSIAFESLYLKYRNKIHFKTIFFGPIKTGMNPFIKHTFLTLSEDDAVNTIIAAISDKKVQYYSPWSLFVALKLAKLLPSSIYFRLLGVIDQKLYPQSRKPR